MIVSVLFCIESSLEVDGVLDAHETFAMLSERVLW